MPTSTEDTISSLTENTSPPPSLLCEVGSTRRSERVSLQKLGYGYWQWNVVADMFSTTLAVGKMNSGRALYAVPLAANSTTFAQANFVLPPGLSTQGATFQCRFLYRFDTNSTVAGGSTAEVMQLAAKINMWSTGNDVLAASTTTSGTATVGVYGPSTNDGGLLRQTMSTDIVTSAAGEKFGCLSVFRDGASTADTAPMAGGLVGVELFAKA